ncbi:hypothetical protein AGABI1DRAFT_129721 [Agaricus bisporus var. burnettii JB137-S8]|uniref:F-box domain-containing protein n=1 Tax=Agaricus bisporus var. burnettii (strain JB137-S8 / ATCC MYA-4627 / FGSC 10392) TaxID=597362 RepID=K5XSJ5_AGABU|nr:uncharacterized protein AGABI1DRAFT_129721 [Agaricus bisporus var. burnettii JB137-S8]EKM77930.1 hypothetical protein AGABI1DRAFT_129721 [Agaricus bisporus var. burnettii JB137-S8]
MPSRVSQSRQFGTHIATRHSKESHATDELLPSLLQPQRCIEAATFGHDLVSNLPTELLIQIMDFCDGSTYFRLAQVNRHFNRIITDIILAHNQMGSSSKHIWFYYYMWNKPKILAALSICLSDKYVLSEFYYSFNSEEAICHHLAAITRFFQNRVMSIERLKLDFPSTNQPTLDEAIISRSTLVTLLEVALAKGCLYFELNGHIDCFLPHSSPRHTVRSFKRTSSGERKSRRGRVLSWFKSHLSPSTPPPLPFFDSPPSLNKLTINSCLMLDPSFRSHTFGLLQSQSPTLRKLKLHRPEPENSICEEFFSSKVSLPALESFTYTYYEPGYPLAKKFDALYGFLARHPSIQKIKFPPISAQFNRLFPAFKKCPKFNAKKLFLPNLQRVYGHPRIISWFLQDPKAFSKLEHVSLEARNKFLYESYYLLDDALIALGSRMSDVSPSGGKSPIHLELKVSVDANFCQWLSKHIEHPNASPIQNLKGVETLTICAKDGRAKLEVCHLDQVIAWASLFPSLKRFRLDMYSLDLYKVISKDPQAFSTSVMDKCLGVEICSVTNFDCYYDGLTC